MAKLTTKKREVLNAAVDGLKSQLGDNLYACVVYGSAVRGDFVPVASDVNLLIVLNESTPQAHAAIAGVARGKLRIDPFVIGRPGMERSLHAFAVKFLSIQRDYEVLHGVDPLAGFEVTSEHERFLCEQQLRNVRLRLVRGFIVFGGQRWRYRKFLTRWIPTVFVDVSEALRLAGVEIPHDFADRIPVIAREFEVDASVLKELLVLKESRPSRWTGGLSARKVRDLHSRTFSLLTKVIQWMETRWPEDVPRKASQGAVS